MAANNEGQSRKAFENKRRAQLEGRELFDFAHPRRAPPALAARARRVPLERGARTLASAAIRPRCAASQPHWCHCSQGASSRKPRRRVFERTCSRARVGSVCSVDICRLHRNTGAFATNRTAALSLSPLQLADTSAKQRMRFALAASSSPAHAAVVQAALAVPRAVPRVSRYCAIALRWCSSFFSCCSCCCALLVVLLMLLCPLALGKQLVVLLLLLLHLLSSLLHSSGRTRRCSGSSFFADESADAAESSLCSR